MCGVFATTRADLWKSHTDAVLRVLRHRGPDGYGVHHDQEAGVILAHTRLAIIGLSAVGAQPHHQEGSVLAYNGETYNHMAVAHELGELASDCDTPTVHRVLRRRGCSGLDSLDGMFALAWWDARSATLTLARDRWGVKPLYYVRHADGGISAASELPVLRILGLEVDMLGLASYVAFGHTVDTSTVFNRVAKVPPGAFLQFSRRENSSWSLSCGRFARTKPPVTDPIGDAVSDAVVSQLMSDVPVGVFLSGGVDSTLVAACARRHRGELQSYTISFPDSPSIDESPVAERNAEWLELDHHTVPVSNSDLLGAIAPVIELCGEPINDPATLAVYCLAAFARQEITVALTGEGADELFGGYVRHSAIRRIDRARVAILARAVPGLATSWERVRGDGSTHRALAAALLGGGPLGYASMQQAELNVFEPRPDISQSLVSQLRTDWLTAGMSAPEEKVGATFDLSRWLPNTYLEKIDRSTMAHGLEARVPYLSQSVEQVAGSVDAPGKAGLRRALALLAPGTEVPSRKQGLAVDSRALVDGGLCHELDFALNAPESILHEYFGEDVVALIRGRSRRSAAFAFRIATIGLWQQTLSSTL